MHASVTIYGLAKMQYIHMLHNYSHIVYTNAHTRTHIRQQACTVIYIHTYARSAHAHTHTHTHTYTHKHITLIHTYINTYEHVYKYAQTHTRTHIPHTHTYTQTCIPTNNHIVRHFDHRIVRLDHYNFDHFTLNNKDFETFFTHVVS